MALPFQWQKQPKRYPHPIDVHGHAIRVGDLIAINGNEANLCRVSDIHISYNTLIKCVGDTSTYDVSEISIEIMPEEHLGSEQHLKSIIKLVDDGRESWIFLLRFEELFKAYGTPELYDQYKDKMRELIEKRSVIQG
jgi:uncharacterized protein YlxP (DUF503 family)